MLFYLIKKNKNEKILQQKSLLEFNLVKIKLRNFQNTWLKTVKEDRFLME